MIDFADTVSVGDAGWESVTRPLDRLHLNDSSDKIKLGISHQTP